MSYSSVTGLRQALREYESDKVRERAGGAERIREIFGNRENLQLFQETGGQQKGQGWVALFQILFQVVSLEKRGMKRGNASAQTEKRLADAISLVRWMAERSVQLITRRPLIALVTHMTALLVSKSGIFEPAVRDYAKALRTLLSFQPHLDSIDGALWKRLMSIVWAGALGDRISQDDQWQDEGHDELEGDDEDVDMEEGASSDKPSGANGKRLPQGVNNTQSELLLLLPVLLSSSNAPILPAFPGKQAPHSPPTSVGYFIILKIVRFLEAHPHETSAHLSVMRGCNLILSELELNSRDEFNSAGTKLLPHLQHFWQAKSKPFREQVVIAFRMLHPFLTHFSVADSTKAVVLEQYAKLADAAPKEVGLRWGIAPLDMATLLFDQTRSGKGKRARVFEIQGIRPGYDFTHEHAYAWVIIESYATFFAHLILSSAGTSAADSTSTSACEESRRTKRARTDNPLTTLLRATAAGSNLSRLLALQTLVFVVASIGSDLQGKQRIEVQERLLELLDADDETLQGWAYIAGGVAVSTKIVDSAAAERIWGSCIRKMTIANVCRPAAFCSNSLLASDMLAVDTSSASIGSFLRQIDLQGPSYPFDAVTHFVSTALSVARSDVRLYSLNLDEKVLIWLSRSNIVEGTRGASRMEAHTTQQLSTLLAELGGLRSPPPVAVDTSGLLPDCPIVEHVLHEQHTSGIRHFVLDGTMPIAEIIVSEGDKSGLRGRESTQPVSLSPITPIFPSAAASEPDELFVASDKQQRIGRWLQTQLQQEISAPMDSQETSASRVRPAERVRKILDLTMLSISYLGLLQTSHIRTDIGLAEAVKATLTAMRSELSNTSRSISAQHLIWSAFTPLLPSLSKNEDAWPILLRPGESSGTRPDMLPAYTDEQGVEDEPLKRWLECLWQLDKLSDALRSLITIARQSGESQATSTDPTQAPMSTQAPTTMDEEDDFGEIRVAEADAMPLGKEGTDHSRTLKALQKLHIWIRLFGSSMQAGKGPAKDVPLINSMLSMEGTRYLQTAELLSEAVQSGLLRLTGQAVELIVDQLGDTAGSYLYSKDERMLLIVMSFLRCSAPTWLAPNTDIEIREKAMDLAFWIVKKRDGVQSWRVHLALLLFIDEYLDYEPESHLWIERMEQQQESATDEHGNDKLSIPAIMARALVHRDMRVRIRGATSTAGLWYLPTMLTTAHQDFYLAVMNQQPRLPTYWNAFLTDVLWKLNCMVASAAPRPAVFFHLLEIPYTTGAFDLHLERGLVAVAARLGFPSLASLYDTYTPLVAIFMLDSDQSPLQLDPSICGYADRKSRAKSLLSGLTPRVLESSRLDFYDKVCEEAGVATTTHSLLFAYPVAARLLCKAVATNRGNASKVTAEVIDALQSMPFTGKIAAKDILTQHAAQVAVEVLRLVDTLSAPVDMSQAMITVKDADASLFLELTDHLPLGDAAHPDLINPSWSITDLFEALAMLQAGMRRESGSSKKVVEQDELQDASQSAVCFNAVLQLFADMHLAVLVGERRRLAKCIATTIGSVPGCLRDARFLQLIMQEVTGILDLVDVSDFAMYLLDTALIGLTDCFNAVPRLEECFIRLGRVYPRLSADIRNRIDERMRAVAPKWRQSPDHGHIWSTIEAASVLWPVTLRNTLGEAPTNSFHSIGLLARSATHADSMNLCQRLLQVHQKNTEHDLPSDRQAFSRDLFWAIKRSFGENEWTVEGAKAFIDLLAAVEGQVEVVCAKPEENEGEGWMDIRLKKYGHDANLTVQVLAIRHLVKLAASPDPTIRYPAYQVLRQLHTSLAPITDYNLMPKDSRAELPLLLPPSPVAAERTVSMQLGEVQQANLSQYASDPAVWLQKTATCLCEIAIGCSAPLASFYSCITPALTGSIDSLAPFVPILTQAILAGSPDAKALDVRRKIIKHLFEKSLRQPDVDRAVTECVLGVMLRMRDFAPPFRHPRDALGPLTWLDWDYLLLAEAATKAGSFATALLCIDIALSDLPTPTKDSKEAERQSATVQDLLLQIYSNVDDPDGFYGIRTRDVRQNLRRRLDHEGHHMRAFGLHGADLEVDAADNGRRHDLIASARHLHSFGLNRTAQTIAKAVRDQPGKPDHASEDLFFDIAWRTGDWDLPLQQKAVPSSSASFYSALRAVHRERDTTLARARIEAAIKVEMIRLKDLGMERMSELICSIDHLICLGDAHQWHDYDVQLSLSEGDVSKRKIQAFAKISSDLRYSLADRQHAARMSIISASQARESQNLLGDLSSPLGEGLTSLEIESRLRFCRFAREEGNTQAAINAITAVQHLEGAVISDKAADEFGAVLWMQGEHALALQLLDEMIMSSGGKGDEQQRRLGVLIGRQAHWSHLSRQLTGTDVADRYDRSVDLLAKHKASSEEIAQLHYDYASFAADQQQHARDNGELATLREFRARKQVALDNYIASAKDAKRASRSLDESRSEREYSLERENEKVVEHEKMIDRLTIRALRSFAQAFSKTDKFDDALTRMCQIWLAYADSKDATDDNERKRADDIAKHFASHISGIPSHKFIFLGPQLAARLHLSPQQKPFDLQLNALLLRLSQDHPFHILYQIIPLATGITATTANGRPRKSEPAPEREGREPAAVAILQQLDTDHVNPTARLASQQMRAFTDIVTPYCLLPPPKEVKTVKVGNAPIARLPKMSIPIATVIPPVRSDKNYSDVPKLARYGSAYEVLGGIHKPKKMKCYDDNGVIHFQLFKGDDEIRQDAIMEQVFGMTNEIFKRDRQTKARRLNYRTYVVIPLAKRTGILEFVKEGIAIGDWLKPAHDRYRKDNEHKNSQLRELFARMQGPEKPEKDLIERWKKETPKFPPVMRHFFREKQPEPIAWFTMRLNYARSVAVTSMVGHMLGIGDRHLSNIMIDQINGEVIHIDFGIVFEEGANLRIPERVPFRLTRDMIDGLGITGVDGTFRRCAEQTLRVLRTSSPLIMTVLEVFKHDPLFAWMGDPDKMQRAQGGLKLSSDHHNMAQDKADRVLGKIRAKLKDDLGVEYTVNHLVLKATDPVNLATIYHGWHSWF